MASITATLRECHRLRKHIKNLQDEIDRGPRVLKARQAALALEQQAHKDHYEAITQLKLKQRNDEGTLKQTETRLTKLEEQLTGISNQKEYAAKQSEIAQAKEKKDLLEDAILSTMTELEARNTSIPAVEAKWAEAQAEFARYQVEAKERLERLTSELESARATLITVEDELPEKPRKTYDFLTKAHGPEAFAGVINMTCQGCRTTLAQQRVFDIQGGAFTLCSICGKMLYSAE